MFRQRVRVRQHIHNTTSQGKASDSVLVSLIAKLAFFKAFMAYFLPHDSTIKPIKRGLLKGKNRVHDRMIKFQKLVLGVLLWQKMVGDLVKESLEYPKIMKYLDSSQCEEFGYCKRSIIYFKVKLLQLFLYLFYFFGF